VKLELGVALLALSLLGSVHLWQGTPPSPPHEYLIQRPWVAIVGGRAEVCLPRAWGNAAPDRVVNLARRDTDWRSVVAQIDFALALSPPGVLVAAIDPEQLLYHRNSSPDPDRLRRPRYVIGGVSARVYGLFDRWLSLPRLLESSSGERFDAAAWGAQMGEHWADPDGLRAVRHALDRARQAGVEVHRVLLPLPAEAVESWRSGARGEQLDVVLEGLGAKGRIVDEGGYFPDGLACSRMTGRLLLEDEASGSLQ